MVSIMITFRIDICPVPKAAPRASVQGGRARVRKAASTRRYEDAVSASIRALFAGIDPALRARFNELAGVFAVDFGFFLPRPKSRPDWCGREAWIQRWVFAGSKPDWDNYVKSAQDALATALDGVSDDARFVLGQSVKLLCPAGVDPCLVVRVRPAPPTDALPLWVERLIDTAEEGGAWCRG
ncbi:MAG: RusA family crossover junction endodeoxyribonuclease [Rhodocyclaceae bacterium]|nr:MAG: RusA family crossover junction endodeoxyribonuclease [Rhodocyclaceae bacterium]